MVSQVGLNTSIGTNLPAVTSNNAVSSTASGSLFSNYSSVPTNDYSNDIMMTGINFGEIADNLAQSQQLQTTQQTEKPSAQLKTQTSQVPAFSGEENNVQPQISSEQTQISQAAESQKPKSSNIAKILGVATGLVAPLVSKAINLFKGGSFKDIFKFKELAVSCPIFGVVGLGIGMLLDSCIDARKAKSQVNIQNQTTQENQTKIIQNFVNQK